MSDKTLDLSNKKKNTVWRHMGKNKRNVRLLIFLGVKLKLY
jgi:hypothetical protein